MAIVMDSGGRRTASPATGKPFGSSSGNGISSGISSGYESFTGGGSQSPARATASASSTPYRSIPDIWNSVMQSLSQKINQISSQTSRPSGQVHATRSHVPSAYPLNTVPAQLQGSYQQYGGTPLLASQPAGLAAATGSQAVANTMTTPKDIAKGLPKEMLEPIGIDVDRQAGLDVWEQQAAQRENRPVRAANMFGESYDMSGSDAGWFDKSLNQVGNTPMNDAYLRNAVANGLSEDDAYAISHKPDTLNAEREMRTSRNVSPDVYEGVGWVMDDGTKYDYAHMTADKMTGAQYLKYAEMGMGGRPVNEIDPTEVYSKRREQNEYDFIPFTPDNSTLATSVVGNVLELPGRLGSMLSRGREYVTPDYSISYGSDGTTISGREFDKLSKPFMNQFFYNEQFAPERLLSRSKNGDSTAYVLEHVIPDKTGQDTYHYGSMTSIDQDKNTGQVYMTFSDGSKVDISDDYLEKILVDKDKGTISLPEPQRVPESKMKAKVDIDSLNNIDEILSVASENDLSPLNYANVIYLPDMVMSDGTRISKDDVQRLYFDQTPKDDDDNDSDSDIKYGFRGGLSKDAADFVGGLMPLGPVLGPAYSDVLQNIPTFFDNKPVRLKEQELITDKGFDPTDLGDNTVDWTLGSLPISIGKYMPWIYSVSNALPSMVGADPQSYDPFVDSYNMIAGNYDDKGNMVYGVSDKEGKRDQKASDDLRAWNFAGTALTPLTEMIVGPVGEQIVPLEKIFGKLPNNPTLRQLVRNELIGMIGEGVEEDLGNIFEDWTQYGLSGMFADPVLDENGNKTYDQAMHEIRDTDTPVTTRLGNFFDPKELGNAFMGGAVVDAAMRLPFVGPAIPSAARRSNALRQTGVRQFVDPEEEEEKKRVSESYLEGFNDLASER